MLDGTEMQKTRENAMFSMSFWGADARQKLPKPFGPARWLGKHPKMRFGCQKARAGFESKFKNREKTRGFCKVLQKANKSELQRMRKTKGPWRGRRNVKNMWKHVVLNTFFKKRACKNNGKTDAEPQPKYPQGSRPRAKNARKRVVFVMFCKNRIKAS